MNGDFGVYKQSGRLGSGLVLIPLIGGVAAIVLAIAYAYADVYIPIAGYVSFILTFGFAIGVGFAVSMAAVGAKCRSTGFVHFAGFLIGLLALYVSWAAFVFVLIKRELPSEIDISLPETFLEPALVWNMALTINESGWYSIRDATPKGTTLWILWGIEALIVVGGVALISATGIAGRVFCERCTRWCDSVKDFMRLALPNDENLMIRLSGGHLDALGELPVVSAMATPYLRVDVQRCQSCTDTATWQVFLVTHQQTKEGKLQEKEQGLTQQQLLTPEQLQKLNAFAARRPIEEPPPEEQAESDEPSEATTDSAAHDTGGTKQDNANL